jgi:hypothetical protein
LDEKEIGSHVSVIDPFGRTILNLGIQQNIRNKYDVELSAGVYLLHVANELDSRSERLVID